VLYIYRELCWLTACLLVFLKKSVAAFIRNITICNLPEPLILNPYVCLKPLLPIGYSRPIDLLPACFFELKNLIYC